MRTNLHHLVEHRARSHPDSPALTFKKETLSYEALWTQVRGVAAGFRELGVVREQRVAVFLDKRIETVVAIFGASAAGAAFVPVNPLLRPAQVGHILRDCDVRVLVTSPERLALMRDELASCPSVEDVVLVGARFEEGEPTTHYRVHGWERLRGSDHAVPAPSVIDLDIAAILYTSGSTGRPKGVVLSHRNLIAGAESVAAYLGNTADDVLLAALPLSFDAGFSQLTTAFAVGAQVILMNYLLPGDVPRLCARHGVTGLTCVPPLWIQIAEQKWPQDARASLRYFANTGGRMPKPVLDRLREVFPSAKPFLMYGLTEAFRSTYLDPAEVDRRPDSIGKAIPGAEILVVRADGSSCDPGEEGELVHRGPHVALGYWNDPVRTAERFRPVPGRNASLAHTRTGGLVGRRRGRRRRRLSLLRRTQGRDDQDVRLPGQPHRDRGGRLRHHSGARRGGTRCRGRHARATRAVGGRAGREGVRHRHAARGDEVPAAAVHGAQLSGGSRRDTAFAQR